jgi:WD40 repeat protein
VFRGDELPVPANEYTYEQKEVLRLNLTKMLAFSPDGKCVAVGTSGGWVSVWDINQRGRIWRKQPKVKDNQIRSLAFSPDSKWLASANDSLAIWRVSDGYQVNDGKTLAYRTLFLPGKKLLLVDPRSIHGFMCWDLTTGRYLNEDWRLPRPTYTEKGVDDETWTKKSRSGT